MWCPSASLTVWVNAWLAGMAAPDDVLDALSQWAPKHSVTAYDSVAAASTGLPWPDLDHSGTMSLLQTMRTAAGPAAGAPALSLVLPVPGDVRGLPPDTQFQRDAITMGEAIIVGTDPSRSVGMVPEYIYEDIDDPDFEPDPVSLAWTVYSVPAPGVLEHLDLGEAEYTLRSAVRSAADALGALSAGIGVADIDDPRGMVEQLLEATRLHRLPDHAPERAARVLENAAHVDAIITASSGLMPIGLQTSSEVRIASDTLRPLASVVRSARLAAISAILYSAWRR
ncbi:hypothetical protein [Mycolicibacterium bacteremicum]|uniref:Uncharacterized protein n=1 Tax=Mycolicibacterium bacteremicum TaxID=564198 RepID=A0A1W9Z3W6_MYCBA|nr:hypothetical protein [Mycolicibacterium bacteremicum]MCV7433970.1 hypothetical protein [Mycolicibacterium bacteremicum]ORA07021.1 hypothetical protein BST17_00660 [Mycolicibacterium bacteremicum]